jgi:SMI1 / KNR4 family (SUKH-1)
MNQEIERLVQPWRGKADYDAANGAVLICHWPSEGPIAYLHKLFAPASTDDIDLVRDECEFELPVEYRAFLQEHNGARLFLGAISLWGVVGEILRSTSRDLAQPVSLLNGLEVFRATAPARWRERWRAIGGIATDSRWSIEIHETGIVAAVRNGRERAFIGLSQLLQLVVDLMGRSFTRDGMQLDDWNIIDRRLCEELV